MIHVMASIIVGPEHAAAAIGAAMPMLASPLAVHGFDKIG